MTITDLIIDPKSLGTKLWLVDVMPVYEYRNNRRTENVTGYRYVVAMPERNLDKISIKIEGKKQMEQPIGYAEVTFHGLEVFIYWMNGQQRALHWRTISLKVRSAVGGFQPEIHLPCCPAHKG